MPACVYPCSHICGNVCEGAYTCTHKYSGPRLMSDVVFHHIHLTDRGSVSHLNPDLPVLLASLLCGLLSQPSKHWTCTHTHHTSPCMGIRFRELRFCIPRGKYFIHQPMK